MNRIIPYQNGLCRSLDPHTRHDVVYTRPFAALGLAVSLRPLCLESDVALLHNWVKREYIRPAGSHHIPYEEIIQTLIHTSWSDFAQVFTAIDDNDQPLGEIQVFRAKQDDELGINSVVRPDDYVLHLMPNHARPEQYCAVIQTCTEYCLQHEEVKRLLALADEEDTRENKLLKKAGFRLLSKIGTPYKTCNLYEYP